jgi:endonuclease YncB( thermonuclease family)
MRHSVWILAAGLWAAAAQAAPAAIEGRVAKVIDGDTLQLQQADGRLIDVALAGIDAPELCQPWGGDARDALKEWVQGQPVTFRPSGKDERGRTLGALFVDGVELNRRMVEEGHAWSQRVKWDRGPYVKQERMARSLGRGLHGTPGAQAPADFRRIHGPCVGGG